MCHSISRKVNCNSQPVASYDSLVQLEGIGFAKRDNSGFFQVHGCSSRGTCRSGMAGVVVAAAVVNNHNQ